MFVYMLQYEGLILYVGKTTDYKRRYREHCYRRDSCGSRDIPTDMPWTMALLEECEDVLGTSKEQFYYDSLKPLYNKKRPGQTHAEYQRAHPEVHREASRKFHAANRETCNAKRRENRERARAKKQLNAVPTTLPQTEVAV